jgi:hypothetical protein
LWFHMKFRIFLNFCEKCHWHFERDESVDYLE